MLDEIGYSLQANRKTEEGPEHPDRDAQFEYINRQVRGASRRRGQPVISVDAKKKELVGDFRNPGPRMAPPRSARTGASPRLSGRGVGQGHPVWRLRLDPQRSLGQRRHRPRHGRVRRREHPALVAEDGLASLSARQPAADHGRCRGEQRLPLAVVEGGVAGLRRRARPADHRLPLSAGDEQVEQDRASYVLPHHRELARSTAGQSRGDRELDRACATREGLRIEAELDTNIYPKGIKVSDAELARYDCGGRSSTGTGTTLSSRKHTN